MAWLRYSDDYTGDKVWDGVSYEARWYFKALVEACSQSRRWDGSLPLVKALRTSDVPDTEDCLRELRTAGLVCVTVCDTGHANLTQDHAQTWTEHIEACATEHEAGVAIPTIEDHIPPAGSRDENLLPRKKANTAAWRARKCAGGEHTKDCPSATCPVKLQRKAAREAEAKAGQRASETERVTGHAGTGQDGTGRETLTNSHSDSPLNLSTDVGKKTSQLNEKQTDDWPATAVVGAGLPSSVEVDRKEPMKPCPICDYPVDPAVGRYHPSCYDPELEPAP